jgi:hypothetical protein
LRFATLRYDAAGHLILNNEYNGGANAELPANARTTTDMAV